MKNPLTPVCLAAVVALSMQAAGIVNPVTTAAAQGVPQAENDRELNAALQQAASQMNASLPMMVDKETRLDSTLALDGTFRYNYTLVNYPAESLDAGKFTDAMQPRIVNSICTMEDTQMFVNNGVRVIYAYFGRNGKSVTKVTVEPSMCDDI
jgi:hypothetical protein